MPHAVAPCTVRKAIIRQIRQPKCAAALALFRRCCPQTTARAGIPCGLHRFDTALPGRSGQPTLSLAHHNCRTSFTGHLRVQLRSAPPVSTGSARVRGLTVTPVFLLGRLFVGGNTVQMILALTGAFALGAALALGVADMNKLPLNGTIGDDMPAIKKTEKCSFLKWPRVEGYFFNLKRYGFIKPYSCASI